MKIVLLYGGKSAEHEISILTASAIQAHMDYDNNEIQLVYITQQGNWIDGGVLKEPLDSSVQLKFEPGDAVTYHNKDQSATSIGRPIVPTDVLNKEVVAFPLLHGPNGEDGTIQGLFETLDIPYVGAGVLASAVGLDKITSKRLFQEVQIPQVPFTPVTHYEWEQERAQALARIEGKLVYPIFVKPSNLGSSVGVSCVHNREELVAGIEEAFKYDRRLIIEQGIEAREVEVAVMGNDIIETSVPGEIVKEVGFYNYDEKYVNNTVQLAIPADLPGEVCDSLRKYAERAYATIDSSGLTRVDFFVTHNYDIFINEVNTLPGFTPFSMYPLLWEATGKTYSQLLQDLIQLAIERYETYAAFD